MQDALQQKAHEPFWAIKLILGNAFPLQRGKGSLHKAKVLLGSPLSPNHQGFRVWESASNVKTQLEYSPVCLMLDNLRNDGNI